MAIQYRAQPARVVSHLTLTMLLIVCTACKLQLQYPIYSSQSSSGSEPIELNPESTESNSEYIERLHAQVELEAKLRYWTDDRLVVDYVLHNRSGTDLIALTGNLENLHTALMPDGGVRLFHGKQDIGDTDLHLQPIIVGQSLSAATSLSGSGSSTVPFQLDLADSSANPIDLAVNGFEFCVGYGLAEALEPMRVEDDIGTSGTDPRPNMYSFSTDLELQRFACTNLQRNSEPPSAQVSPLDGDHWEAAVKGVFSVLNDKRPFIVSVYKFASELNVPEQFTDNTADVVTFVNEDSSVGTRTRVTCPGGGYYDVTKTSASADRLILEPDNCVFGENAINGFVERFTYVNDHGDTVIRMMFKDYSAVTGAQSMRIFSGIYELDDGHPVSLDVMNGINYEWVNDDQTITMTNVIATDTSFWYDTFERTLSASFTVSAPWTLDQSVKVFIPTELDGRPIGGNSDAAGLLMIETEQGDRLTVDADSGQDNSALITLTHAGVVSTEYREWETLLGNF